MDKYIADMIANGKFDGNTLEFVDIGRSNDLLKNLSLSNNKKAILEHAFVSCPYNIAVYMQAMKYDLLDYDAFHTAKIFKQDHLILSFFKQNWGEASFPTKFNINYNYINVWASLTGQQPEDLLHGLTAKYAIGIIHAYSRVSDILADKSSCQKIIGEMREDVILSGNSICRGNARKYVEPIVAMSIWTQLTERCGHSDLLDQIKKYFPTKKELHTKNDLDTYAIEQLTSAFEEARQVIVTQIKERRQEAEQQKAEQERIAVEKKARQKATAKKLLSAWLLLWAS